jgi:GR25 family glycosyltransferase involved in LPS biosynthesis
VKSLVINLDSDTDRLAKVEQEFAAAGMAFERVPAIYGTDLPDDIEPYSSMVTPTMRPTLRLERLAVMPATYRSGAACCWRKTAAP